MKKTCVSIIAVIGMALASQASTIVNWGSVSGTSNLVGDTTILTSGNAGQSKPTTTYDDTVQINPADGINGYDINAAGQTRIFYGASSINQAANVVNNAGDGDHLQLVYRTAAATYNAMLAWKAADFMTADRTLETMSLSFEDRTGVNAGAAQMYFLLQTSDGWYRSNESATESDGNYITWTANAGDLTWSAFSEFGVTGGAVAADTTDIQSVGYYSAGSNGTGALNWTGSKVINFEVTAIPEPATLGLVAAMGGGLLFIRRRSMM